MLNILLVSGGIDSIYLFLKHKYDKYIFIDYNQPSLKEEMRSLDHFGVPYETIQIHYLPTEKTGKVTGDRVSDDGYVWGRNLEIAMVIRKLYHDKDIALHWGVNGEDCGIGNTPVFLKKVEDILNESYKKRIRMVCPLETMMKAQVVEEINKVITKEDFKFLWTCEQPEKDGKQCGKCRSCIDADENERRLSKKD